MNNWEIFYTPDAQKDRRALEGSVRLQVDKAIAKVARNPLPKSEGGYGEPLGNAHGRNLTGLCKIKLKEAGIRVVYKLIRTDGLMRILVIAARADAEFYDLAEKRGGDGEDHHGI
ncbi:MAG: type II toxin-antitoxin system RelE/ParE family toxin [Oscillospiraceae bacterium]|jgi:mRNA interferase RelE/StbE|nr:type II toxin-antitoxin system RelE/ParE family toxin [Oscillospiraceae bacterium]